MGVIISPAPAQQPAQAGAVPTYCLYGLPVLSEVPLPVPPMRESTGQTPTWSFRRAAGGEAAAEPDGPVVATVRLRNGAVVSELHRGPGGIWIRNLGIGIFHILAGARLVDVYPAAGVQERLLGLVLAGQVSTLLLQKQGYPCLHASAVVTERGALAFLGPNGRGKSTVVARFLQQGDALLTDDILPLHLERGDILGMPGLPIMKLWSQSVELALGSSDELPNVLMNLEKKLVVLEGRYSFAKGPVRLDALYFLARYDPIAARSTATTIDMLDSREGFTTLLAQTAYGSLVAPDEAAAFLPIYARLARQAPVRVLRYPSGFEYQEQVHARLRADCGVV